MSTTTTSADVISAHHRDALAAHRNRPATEDEFLDVVADAMRWSFPRLSEQERKDLASEVRERIARKHGWYPPMSALDRPLLAGLARTAWRDKRKRIADVADASAATDAAEHGGAFSALSAHDLPAADAGWEQVSAALGYDDPASAEATAIYAALSGYGTGAELAKVLGITPETARKRLERGRERLARRYPNPDALGDALADAGAADRPLTAGPVPADGRMRQVVTYRLDSGRVVTYPAAGMFSRLAVTNPTPVDSDRVRLDSVRRFWLALLDRMASTATAPHAASMDRDPRTDAPRSVAGPAAILRCQPERVAVSYRRADYLPTGEPMDTAPQARPLGDRQLVPNAHRSPDADSAWAAAIGAVPAPRFQPMSEAQLQAEADSGAETARRRLAYRWAEEHMAEHCLSRFSPEARI